MILLKGKWTEPFNDQYVNFSRDGLPIVTKISDIVERITAITEKAILANGGKKQVKDGQLMYTVACDF